MSQVTRVPSPLAGEGQGGGKDEGRSSVLPPPPSLPRKGGGGALAGHQRLGTRAKARIGLPVPFTNFSGAAIRMAPFGGSLSRLARLARP